LVEVSGSTQGWWLWAFFFSLLLLFLGEKVLLVCRLVLLFPFLLSPGMDLWDCLSGILSFFLECLLLGDLDQDSLSSLP
jgi:hypothetical protein